MRLAVSGLANWQQWLWALNVCVQVGVCYLILRRGAYKYLPFFFFYLVSDLALSAVTLVSYRLWGFSSWTSYRAVWSAQAVVVAARGIAVAEICKNSLREYRGVWAFGWRILASVGAVVVVYAGLALLVASKKASWVAAMVLTSKRGLELAVVAVLFSLLIFARYYGIVLNRPHKALAVGFCLFSGLAVLNDTILSVFLKQYTSVWNGIEMSSYFGVLIAWWRALYKVAPVQSPVPVLIPQTVYEEFAPQMNYRLRSLNDRLFAMLKS